jgi:hypothetical protein
MIFFLIIYAAYILYVKAERVPYLRKVFGFVPILLRSTQSFLSVLR